MSNVATTIILLVAIVIIISLSVVSLLGVTNNVVNQASDNISESWSDIVSPIQ